MIGLRQDHVLQVVNTISSCNLLLSIITLMITTHHYNNRYHSIYISINPFHPHFIILLLLFEFLSNLFTTFHIHKLFTIYPHHPTIISNKLTLLLFFCFFFFLLTMIIQFNITCYCF